MKKKQLNIKQTTIFVASMGLLIALLFILSMISSRLRTDIIKFSFSFIPVVIAARFFGFPGAVTVAGLGDLVCYLANPQGAWLFPITLNEMAAAAVFCIFLRKSDKFIHIIFSVLITQIVISGFITPLWLSILFTENSYLSLLIMRIPQILIMIAIEITIIPVVLKAANKAAQAAKITF